ncbi:hypothetical protein [Nonlabens marinus]|nr:hypothetical protein [Nonlabens marinus]
MKQFYVLLVIFCFSSLAFSQVGINTISPNESSILDISSNDKGVLFPRMDLGDLNNAAPVSNPEKGLTVWNTNSSAEGLYFWDGAKWSSYVEVTSSSNNSFYTEGDIKHGFQTTDHQGWYLLNGRAISTLPATAQSAAQSLGFSSNLPNATNRVLKARNGSETIGSQAGSNLITLTPNNIPQLTSNTSSGGSHNHGYSDARATFSDNQLRNNGPGENFNGYSDVARTTSDAGSHSHTVTIGNANPTSIINTPSSIVTNIFVYLGN